jgi:riboflavin biosynthesis pyrimidine reductase
MRPRVLCNMACSIDGKIAPSRKSAPFVMSRHTEDPRRMRSLRARTDAVLIGASNLRADDPDLLPSKRRVVVTRSGYGVEPAARMFDRALGGEAVVAHAATMTETKRAALSSCATLLELGDTEVNVRVGDELFLVYHFGAEVTKNLAPSDVAQIAEAFPLEMGS